MLVLRLALKNLSRNRRRTALTAISIIAGIGIFVVGEAFIGGTEENIVVSAEQGTVGTVLARPAKYPTIGHNAPLDRLIDVTPQARALLDQEAAGWTGRVLFAPTMVHGAQSVRARAIGYDTVRDVTVFPHDSWKLEGRAPSPEADEIMVSPSIARLLSVKPGDRVVLQVKMHHGALNALEVQITGVYATGNMALDALGLFAPLQLTQKLTGADAPTHLSVHLSSRSDAAAFKPRLQAALGEHVEVVTYADEVVELLALQNTRRASLDLLVFIILALAGFGVANTFLMAAYERTREVGTLRAMGMTEGAVVRLFLLEGTLVGLFSSVLGAAWGGGLARWWSLHPIDFTETLQKTSQGISVSAIVYTKFSPAVLLVGVTVGVGVALAASWYPARVASSLRPADAVRA